MLSYYLVIMAHIVARMPKEEVAVFTKNRIAIAIVAALCGVSATAQAETLTDFFKQSKIDNVRPATFDL